ncbi:MAG: aspartyl protease family protein [bacterium]
MNIKRSNIIILIFLFSASLFLSGCGGGGSGGSPGTPSVSGSGGTASSARFETPANANNLSSGNLVSWPDTNTVSISGTVTADGAPVSGATVYLYEIGSSAPLNSALTDSNGRYGGLSYVYPDGSKPVFYVAAAGGAAASNSKSYTLMNLYIGDSIVNINEFTTAEVGYALNEAGGSINNRVITVNNTGIFTGDYDALTDAHINNNELYYIADSLAYCIKNASVSGSCYMSAAFSNDGLPYTQGSGEFTLLAAQNYNSSVTETAADIKTAAYGSYYGFYSGNGALAPFIITNSSPVSAVINTMNVYLDAYGDENAPDVPYVNVYINGGSTPVHLVLDTGATGIMINRSALAAAGVNAPVSSYSFSGGFGDGGTYSGYVSYANVSTSGGLTAQNIPLAVAVTDTDFPSTGFLQGDFGMGLSPYTSFGYDAGSGYNVPFTPSFANAIPAGYNNGFILNFNNISFTDGYNNTISSSTPAGTLTYGLNTAADNIVPGGSNFYPNQAITGYNYSYPMVQSEFGGQYYNSAGQQFYSFFDTGSSEVFLGNGATDYSIAGFSQFTDVDNSYICGGFILGGLTVNLGFINADNNYISNNFITEPDNSSNSFCDYNAFNVQPGNALALDNALYYGLGLGSGQEDFGLPFIYNHPMYWQALSPAKQWGVGIE